MPLMFRMQGVLKNVFKLIEVHLVYEAMDIAAANSFWVILYQRGAVAAISRETISNRTRLAR